MSRLADATGRGRGSDVPLPPFPWFMRIVVPVAIVAAAIALLVASGWSWLVPAREVRGFPVLVEPVAAEAPTAAGPAVQAAGWIEPSPFPSLATALEGGVVREILVLEGEKVARGQPIATLVDDEARIAVQIARADRTAREAAVSLAEARLVAARAAHDGREAGIRVLEAGLREKRAELARAERAVESGGSGQGRLAELRFAVEGAEAAVAVADAAGREAEATAAGVEAELAAAGAELMHGQLAVAAAELRLERMTVRSPIDGTLLERLVGPGHALDPDSTESAAVASVYDPALLQVRADLPNADLALVGVGMPAEITAEALPGRRIAGTVLRILHRADIQKNTVAVQVLIESPPPELRPGMLCRVTVNPGGSGSAGGSRQRILAMRSPLATDGSFAIVAATGVAELRAIRLGSDAGDGWVEILEGLRPGDVVVDAATVREGERVRVRPEPSAEAPDAR
jgi:multidrug efflux pump subunit AcrA (membrane-fusion protein)